MLFNLNEYGKRKFKQLAQAYFQTDELVDKLIRDSEKVGTNFNDISERKNWINENEGTLKNLTWYCIKGTIHYFIYKTLIKLYKFIFLLKFKGSMLSELIYTSYFNSISFF